MAFLIVVHGPMDNRHVKKDQMGLDGFKIIFRRLVGWLSVWVSFGKAEKNFNNRPARRDNVISITLRQV